MGDKRKTIKLTVKKMKFNSEGDKDDKNETIKDERGWRESIQDQSAGCSKIFKALILCGF